MLIRALGFRPLLMRCRSLFIRCAVDETGAGAFCFLRAKSRASRVLLSRWILGTAFLAHTWLTLRETSEKLIAIKYHQVQLGLLHQLHRMPGHLLGLILSKECPKGPRMTQRSRRSRPSHPRAFSAKAEVEDLQKRLVGARDMSLVLFVYLLSPQIRETHDACIIVINTGLENPK